MRNRRKIGLILAAVLALFVLSGCSQMSTAPDEAGLHYKAGPLSATEFANCINPGQRAWDGPSDDHYAYPAGQRTWKFDGDGNGHKSKGADADAIRIVSKDNVTMTISGVLAFHLNTDCDTLRKFHEQIGIKHQPIMDGGKTASGWVDAIDIYVDQPLRTTVSEAAAGVGYRDLYNGAAARDLFERAVNGQLESKVRAASGDDYFKGFSVTVQKPEAPDAIVTALEAEQAAVAQNNAQKARNATVNTELESIRALVRVLGPEGYVQYKALQDGRITILPVPSGTGLVINPPAK